MIIKAKKKLVIEVVTHLDRRGNPQTEDMTLEKGEEIDVDLLQETKDQYREIQFGNGDMAYGLRKKDFKEVSRSADDDEAVQ